MQQYDILWNAKKSRDLFYFIETFCSIQYIRNLHAHENTIREIYYR